MHAHTHTHTQALSNFFSSQCESLVFLLCPSQAKLSQFSSLHPSLPRWNRSLFCPRCQLLFQEEPKESPCFGLGAGNPPLKTERDRKHSTGKSATDGNTSKSWSCGVAFTPSPSTLFLWPLHRRVIHSVFSSPPFPFIPHSISRLGPHFPPCQLTLHSWCAVMVRWDSLGRCPPNTTRTTDSRAKRPEWTQSGIICYSPSRLCVWVCVRVCEREWYSERLWENESVKEYGPRQTES